MKKSKKPIIFSKTWNFTVFLSIQILNAETTSVFKYLK